VTAAATGGKSRVNLRGWRAGRPGCVEEDKGGGWGTGFGVVAASPASSPATEEVEQDGVVEGF
jgi:hypothetical protein